MTTARNIANIARDTGQTPQTQGRFRLPDPPQREPDEMTSFNHLHKLGNTRYLIRHFGKPETTLVTAEHWIVPRPGYGPARRRIPDLLIAFDVDPVAHEASNGYIVTEQGKPPDFVMEIASLTTADKDIGEKRDDYMALGITEYWRFDETGEHHGAKLAGEKLAGGVYVPIPIVELEDGVLQGYSAALDLNIRWEHGRLGWYDPKTGRHITTIEDMEALAEDERKERIREQEARTQAEAKNRELEAKNRELEEEIRRLRGG